MGKSMIVGMFIVCSIIAVTLQLQASAEPVPVPHHRKEGKFAKEYDNCMGECIKKCDKDGQHYTDCELACDEDCSEQNDNDKVKNFETKSKEKELKQDIDTKDKTGGRKRK